MIKLGFVILSHRRPEQTRRLIDRLVAMFDAPPIVCHHDFDQCTLDVRGLPATFRLIEPHFKTAWAEFSIVEATLVALRMLYQTDDPPDWFALLSGADYPIKTADKILADLATIDADALIRHRLIDRQAPKHSFERSCLRRYHRWAWRMPPGASPFSLPRAFRLSWRISGPWLPFSQEFRCFAGSQFFTANDRCAEHLLMASRRQGKLARHYATVPFPEESYFQCLLCNAPPLRLKNDNYRHIIWRDGGAHPKTLTCDDLPEMNASHAHFARKFDVQQDSAVLDCLDGVLLRRTSQATGSQIG